MSKLDTILTTDLVNVTGGNGALKAAGKGAQKAYKWWTGSQKAGAPKDIYKEGKDVVKDVALGAGGVYAGKKLIDGMTAPDPTAK